MLYNKIQDTLKSLGLGKYGEPQYGNYIGSRTKCKKGNRRPGQGCPGPVDDYDALGVDHDINDSKSDPWADAKFVGGAMKILPNVFIPGRYDRPVYGRLHHIASIPAMTLRGLFTTPKRLIENIF